MEKERKEKKSEKCGRQTRFYSSRVGWKMGD
jgi:hypothetical protein